ncbi:MAG: RagB/SusD family nutrient uptake outer membrane protein [Mangrovibacterium sp.]
MKTAKYILILLCSVIAFGCGEDFLDRTPISNANEDDFYKTEDDITTALWAAYNSLYTIYDPAGMPSFFGELMSDNAYSDNSAGRVQDYEGFEKHTMSNDNELVLDYWNNYYEAIYIVNNIISNAEEATFDSRDALIGEAKFLRALYYFDMVRAWGDVPLVDQTISIEEAYATGRTDKNEVYGFIIEDLTFAIDNLPDKTNERFEGAATSDAANTLLGKVYLTIGEKSEAATVLQKVYDKFELVPYADLWDLSKKNCAESIFEIQYEGGVSNPYSLYWAMFTPVDNRVVTAWGAGYNQVTTDLWNAYEDDDPRRDLSIQNGYTASDGSFVEVKFPIKWKDENAEVDGLREAADNNFIVLRYADVLLMLTEATGDEQYLNEVRDRVGLPHYGAEGYPSEYNTVDLALEHECQVEFACEFHRWFDLIRTDRAITVIKNSTKNITISEDDLLLPIPLEVITQNPDMITQNEAYK